MIKLFEHFKDNINLEHVKKNSDDYLFIKMCFNFFKDIHETDDDVYVKFDSGDEYVTLVTRKLDRFTILVSNNGNYINIFYDQNEVDEKYPLIFGYMFSVLEVHLDIDLSNVNNYKRDVYFQLPEDLKYLKNINFSKEEYEIFEDTERFGL